MFTPRQVGRSGRGVAGGGGGSRKQVCIHPYRLVGVGGGSRRQACIHPYRLVGVEEVAVAGGKCVYRGYAPYFYSSLLLRSV